MNRFTKTLLTLFSFFILKCGTLEDRQGYYTLKNVGKALTLKILSFNILSPQDGKAFVHQYGTWSNRRGRIFALVGKYEPDLIGFQESDQALINDIRDEFFDSYELLEHTPYTPDAIILYKRSVFDLIEHGHWILQGTDTLKMRRIAVWVKLRHKDSKREILFVNTHVDANIWRAKQTALLKKNLNFNEQSSAPLFLAGDFNTSPNEDNYPNIVTNNWKDAYLDVADPLLKVGTYPSHAPTRRIDYILYNSSAVKTKRFEIFKEEIMSDHLPVFAEFSIDGAIK